MATRAFAAVCSAAALLVASTLAQASDAEGEGMKHLHPLKRPFEVKIQLGDSELAILDLRSRDLRSRDLYLKSHVPGAVHVDVAQWKEKSLSETGLDDLEWWAKELGSRGVGTTSQVVVYGDDPREVARAWWILRYLGVKHASILDGGFAAWKQANAPLEWDAFPAEERTFVPMPEKAKLCPLSELRQTLASNKSKVLDVRSPEEYGGKSDGDSAPNASAAGHIPGATNLEWSELLQPNGTYKDAATIRELLKAKGFEPDDAVVVHCQAGGRASAAVFALELAGFENVQNYYPGWSEYGSAKDLPAERAGQP
jgi:thiosulfate/3-mercaptopyruvate sulfurtransferase